MRRTLRTIAATSVALLAAAAIPMTAAAEEIPVNVTADGRSRQLQVQTVDGEPLESLDVNSNGTASFRVRVVDDNMHVQPFTVVAEMTDLYQDRQTTAARIGSAQVSVIPAGPANVIGLEATVTAVGNVTGQITGALCSVVGLLGIPCNLDLGSLDALAQTVSIVDATTNPLLAPLTISATGGTFDNPSFSGFAADDPRAGSAPAATQVELLTGANSAADGFLGEVDGALNDILSGLSASEIVGDASLRSALRGVLGSAYDLLSTANLDAVLDLLGFVVQPTGLADIDGIDGTWNAYHDLHVNVPDGVDPGTYEGVMTVTLVQL